MSDPTREKPSREEQSLKWIADLIARGELELFSDVVRKSYLRFVEVPHIGTLRLEDRDLSAVIAHLFWQKFGEVLSPSEINRVLFVLRGQALANQQQKNVDDGAVAQLERDGLARLVLGYLGTERGHNGSCEELRAKLVKFANDNNIAVTPEMSLTHPTVLSKKLRQASTLAVLRHYGIKVIFPDRSARSRKIKLVQIRTKSNGKHSSSRSTAREKVDRDEAPAPSGAEGNSCDDAASVTASLSASHVNALQESDLGGDDASQPTEKRSVLCIRLDSLRR